MAVLTLLIAIGSFGPDLPTLTVRVETARREVVPSHSLELRIKYSPANLVPRPQEVLPLVFDVGLQPGSKNSFDLPPGRSVHQREFLLRVSGRLLGVGGHLHEHAESITLIEVETGKVLVTLHPRTDSAGRVLKVTTRLFGVAGEGLRLRADRHYRVVAVYQNPTGRVLADGGMAAIGGIFVPDNRNQLPALDPTDSILRAHRAMLEGRMPAGRHLPKR